MSELDAGRGSAAPVLARVAELAAPQMRAENFPVALRLVPRRPRDQLTRVYVYARFVDDVGDEAPGDRNLLLDAVDADVRALPTGQARLAPVAGLRPVLQEHAVPLEPLLDLIEANRVDQHTRRYESFDDLLDYCRLSAAPIGRLVLSIAEAVTEQNVFDSDAVCAALQVLEHCQDVGEDARASRIYLPLADLRAAAVAETDLTGHITSPQVREVVRAQVERSLDLLKAGPELVRRLSGWARVAVAGYVAGGFATASALRRADYDVLARTIRPGKAATAAHAIRLVAGR
jgi:squalene synthase HpnC